MASPAQTLPTVILDGVITYLENTSVNRVLFRDIRRYPFREVVKLLGVCSWWRNTTLNRMYQHIWWCNDGGCIGCCPAILDDLSTPQSLTTALSSGNISRAKTIALHWKSRDVLRSAPSKGIVFTSITSIHFDFNDELAEHMDPHLDEILHAQTFCAEISRLFPNAHRCIVQSFEFFGKHANRLFVQCLTAGLFTQPVLANSPFSVRALSTLVLEHVVIESSAVEIIRQSAFTLKDLKISSLDQRIFTKVVCSDNGAPIVYPQAGTPFPSLEKLVLGDIYPFGNDIIFRGILEPYGVFSPGYFKELRFIHAIISSYGRYLGSFEEIKSLFHSSTKVSIIKCYGFPISVDPQGLLDDGFGQHIMLLDTPNIKLTIRQTLQLIHNLPNLKRMAILVAETDELRINTRRVSGLLGMWRSITDPLRNIQLPDARHPLRNLQHLYCQYFPLSIRLFQFDGHIHADNPLQAASKMAVIIMALCPLVQRFRAFRHDIWRVSDVSVTRETFVDRSKLEETRHHINLLGKLRRAKP
ncbi:hypothetical protein DL89DRAFT_264952 [Linderina pennispora]|uniref:Uncharacterized protein n=1 Tax=Linderina pennispora TaxID=61395 RepID=A0A1Y1WHZ4_9FUNG|nr:uncharacterized protein DL89DRAFT_264952 [Linderina pennispora]ORX72744.1 hypothetical protein DL89DRAFT_264952 [Linderina pennispora]